MPGQPSPNAKANNARFVTLDALRGLAALLVVCRHYGYFANSYIPRFSYLAVDLFFVLSGFVLAYTYDPRFLAGLSPGEFIRGRIKRLYSLYFLGLAVGVTIVFLIPSQSSPQEILTRSLLNIFGLPTLPGLESGALFALNGAFWSLFFEFWVANLLFAFCWPVLRGKLLWAVIVFCGLGLLISERVNYTLDVGSSWATFGWGFLRVGFSFLVGVVIARSVKRRARVFRVPSWVCLALLTLIIVMPLAGRLAHIFELLAVFVLFPLLIYVGAGAVERKPWVGRALGEASYAIYAIHFPIVALIGARLGSWQPAHSFLAELSVVGLLAAIGWLAQAWLEPPVRRLFDKAIS